MLKPPKNVEEFLKLQNWDYWPREVYMVDDSEWVNDLKKIKEDSSFISIYTHLWENVPRMYDVVGSMEARLEECSVLLQNHATKIFEWDTIISKTGSQRKLESYKSFIRKYHKKKTIMLSDEMETKKNVEGCNFSGFKTNELTQLPRHLDAERIYLFILKTHNFDEKIFKIWKTHFLSEASIALLHDAFWWWFLYKFKPDKQNQDSLFDRISESYVTLFMSIPLNRKDAFFQMRTYIVTLKAKRLEIKQVLIIFSKLCPQSRILYSFAKTLTIYPECAMYPDCLAQAIYATFQEAFPESSDLFNDEFKEDLGNNIFLWLSGLRPQKGFWNHWKLKELATTTIHGTKKSPLKSIQDSIVRSQERIANTIDFNMTKILKNPRANTASLSKEESRPTTKSHYCSAGPEFYRVLLNIGSQSPLILYYLKMHELAGISKAPRKSKMKFTAISREPPPAPTYQDIIKEAKRKFARNQKDFRIEKHRINEEIKFLRQRQERIDKELDRLQAKATKKPYEAGDDFEKFLHNLPFKDQEREFLASLSSSTSEDYNFEDEY